MTGTKLKTSWRDETLHRLVNRPAWLKLTVIAEDTGLTLAWIKDFATGTTANPGICNVETLKDYLDKTLTK